MILFAISVSVLSGNIIGNYQNPGHPDKQRQLDVVAAQIDIWFGDYSLSWEAIYEKLDSLQMETAKRAGERSLAVAYVIHKKGVVQYNLGRDGDLNAFHKAIQLYKEAIAIREQFVENNQEVLPDIINGINNVAGCHLKLNDPFAALSNLSKGLSLAYNYQHEKSVVDITLYMYNTSARSYSAIGDYDNALKYYEYTINFSSEFQDSSLAAKIDVWKIRAYSELASVQANYLNSPEQAILNLNTAKDLLELRYPARKALLAEVYHNLGISYQRLERYHQAIDFYHGSVRINKELDNTSMLAGNYLNLGAIYNSRDQLDSASWYVSQAQEIYQSLEQYYNLSLVYDNLADIEYKKGNYLQSVELDNQSIAYLVNDFTPATIYANPSIDAGNIPDKEGLLVSLDSKATTLLTLFELTDKRVYLDHACSTFILADKLIGLMRSDFIADASKLSLGNRAKTVYEHAVSALYHLYEITGNDSIFTQAFKLSENSRAVTLLDAVRKTGARNSISSQLIDNERMINLKVNYFEKQHALSIREETNEGISETIDSLLLYRRKHDSILSIIEKKFPNYYGLIFNQQTVAPDVITESLGENQLFIEYFVGDSSLFIFAIGADTSIVIRSHSVDSIRGWSSQLNRSIISQDQSFLRPAYQLYLHLIQPIEQVKSLPAQLIIVPDGILNLVNFETLVTTFPDSNRVYFPDFKDFLLYKHQISYAFSATTKTESQIPARSVSRVLLAIAPSFQNSFSIQDNFFDKLEWNIYEVEQIGKLFSNRSLINGDATKQSFARLAPEFGLIHFATHAKADDSQGDLSFIVFGENESEVLYAKDLYTLDINADVVVLSACQTSIGPLSKGEGIISLARGFIYAGASSVVTSLWNVRERTNNNIILEFYDGLKHGLSKDQALREAKISFLQSLTAADQQLAHPYFWGPLICIGNPDPIEIQAGSWPKVILLLTLIIAFLYFFRNRLFLSKR